MKLLSSIFLGSAIVANAASGIAGGSGGGGIQFPPGSGGGGGGGAITTNSGFFVKSLNGFATNLTVYNGGSLVADFPNDLLYDLDSSVSIDLNNHLLKTADNISVDWQSTYLKDNVDVFSLSWSSRLLLDSSGVQSLDWNSKKLSTGWIATNLSATGTFTASNAIFSGSVSATNGGAVNLLNLTNWGTQVNLTNLFSGGVSLMLNGSLNFDASTRLYKPGSTPGFLRFGYTAGDLFEIGNSPPYFAIPSNGIVIFANTTLGSGIAVAIGESGGVVEVNNGTTGTYRDLKIRALSASTTVTAANGYFFNSGQGFTNMYTTNVALDFPSTSVGSVSILPSDTGHPDIDVGDTVIVNPPAIDSLIGGFTASASNGFIRVKFIPTAAAQDPPLGNYRLTVLKTK